MKIIINILFVAINTTVLAQVNYNEAKVPVYTLPDPLLSESGKRIQRITQWEKNRRAEILTSFEKHVFGHTLGGNTTAHEVITVDKQALGGLATRKEVAIYTADDKSRPIHMLIYLPNNRDDVVPVFMGLNFAGNQTVTA